MGIFDRFRHKAHEATGQDAAERAALAHDEAVDAYSSEVERTRETREAEQRAAQEEDDRRAAENMTAEGDPWG
ncbi:hypothetical protein P3T27_003731 [Kitasatospora sp. MAA19]|uniref:hypothetical protein n=1 Tax=unclassified Kitasatospora TaxID=2633591 RepID=UPI002476E57A|nr:hypothetical protein [Kitasatospora sp. MAA19]MDH6707002.1 hypothetical protein [Kitasatospora sp. MAA19]